MTQLAGITGQYEEKGKIAALVRKRAETPALDRALIHVCHPIDHMRTRKTLGLTRGRMAA